MPFNNTSDSVLIIIDIQDNFYGPDRHDIDRDELAAVIERARWVTAVARVLSVPIIVTEEDPDRNGATVSTITTQLPESAPVLPKSTFAVPDNPDIIQALKNTDARTAVLVGTETDICIAHSALRLSESGYRVTAIENAVYSPGDAHQSGLRRMRSAGIELLTAKELLYDWLPTLPEIREFRDSNPGLGNPPGFSL